MDAQIEWLHEEYHRLVTQYAETKDRIAVIANAIKAYGGSIPDIDDIHLNGMDINDVISTSAEERYPWNGTWKEKILHTLKRLGQPSTAAEITAHIVAVERQKNSNRPTGNISNVITTTTSKMGVDGEIKVDMAYRNKYSLLDS